MALKCTRDPRAVDYLKPVEFGPRTRINLSTEDRHDTPTRYAHCSRATCDVVIRFHRAIEFESALVQIELMCGGCGHENPAEHHARAILCSLSMSKKTHKSKNEPTSSLTTSRLPSRAASDKDGE